MRSKRLIIRPVKIEDKEIFLQWWNDGELMKHVGFPKGLNVSMNSIEKSLRDHVKNKSLFVIETNNGMPIGEIGYNLEKDNIRIGIKIGDINAQGKGYGKEALILFCRSLFEWYKVKYILIDTLSTNERAINLYQSIGARMTEVKKGFWTNPEGRVYDAVFFTLEEKDLIH